VYPQLPKKLPLKHARASGSQVLSGGRQIIIWRPPDKIFFLRGTNGL